MLFVKVFSCQFSQDLIVCRRTNKIKNINYNYTRRVSRKVCLYVKLQAFSCIIIKIKSVPDRYMQDTYG